MSKSSRRSSEYRAATPVSGHRSAVEREDRFHQHQRREAREPVASAIPGRNWRGKEGRDNKCPNDRMHQADDANGGLRTKRHGCTLLLYVPLGVRSPQPLADKPGPVTHSAIHG